VGSITVSLRNHTLRFLGGCSESGPLIAATAHCPNSVQKEFSLKLSVANHRLEVQAFLILERVPGSKEFLVSVLLQADGQFIGKTYLGTAAEGQEILLSLRWDKRNQRFVASSQATEGAPVLSFIPFASSASTDVAVPPDFSIDKTFVLKPESLS
jgi:hypothetical protein